MQSINTKPIAILGFPLDYFKEGRLPSISLSQRYILVWLCITLFITTGCQRFPWGYRKKTIDSTASAMDSKGIESRFKTDNQGANAYRTDAIESSPAGRLAQLRGSLPEPPTTANNESLSKAVNHALEKPTQEPIDEQAIATLPANVQEIVRRQILAARERQTTLSRLPLDSKTERTDPLNEGFGKREQKSEQEADPYNLRHRSSQAAAPEPPHRSERLVQENRLSSVDLPGNLPDPESLDRVGLELQSTAPTNRVSIRLSDSNPSSQRELSKPTEPRRSTASIIETSTPDFGIELASSKSSPSESSHSLVQPAVAVSNPIKSEGSPVSTDTSPSNWRQSLTQSINLLEQQLEKSPVLDENLRIHLESNLRFLYLANGQLEQAMRPIPGLGDGEREYFQNQFQALSEATNPEATPIRSRRWSLVMNSQREATKNLAAVSNLEIKRTAFCTDVDGYGVITPFANNQFRADQPVLLYCELDNVSAQKIKDSRGKESFETQLQGSYEIVDSNGRQIVDQLLAVEREICMNHRRDYFIVYSFNMPLQITPGNYQLRIVIEDMKAQKDMKARKSGKASLDLQIVK